MITVTPTCKTSLSQALSYESNTNNLRDASLTSYVNGAEENFVRKLAESSQKLNPTLASQEKQHYLDKNKEEDEEIEVFSAEKYFNGAMDDSPKLTKVSTRKHPCVKDEQVKVAPVKPKIQPGTPSVRSESCWNSLLQSALRNPSRKQTNKIQWKNFFTGLRCKCSSSDKESVDINEHIGEISFKKSSNCSVDQGQPITKETIKPSQPIDTVQIDEPAGLAKEDLGLNRENCFSFPTMNSRTENLPIKIHFEREEEATKPRKSLEVFGYTGLEKRNKSLSLERRQSMLAWDATPRLEKFEYSATPGGESYNDAASDASSDLFEIESLTGKANAFLARRASDATSDCTTPTACYAPSEASIEWSVVTASAADFSVMSDYEELRPTTTATSPVKTFSVASNAKSTTITELPNRRPSISLGYKSHKAVRVAGDAYRTNEKAVNYDTRMCRMSDSFTPITSFQAEAKLTGFDSRQRQHVHTLAATRSLPRSHPPRPSNLLYIQ